MKAILSIALSLLFVSSAWGLSAAEYVECLDQELTRVAKTPNADIHYVTSEVLDGLPETAQDDLKPHVEKAKSAESCEDLAAKYKEHPNARPPVVTEEKFRTAQAVLKHADYVVAANSLTYDHQVLIAILGDLPLTAPHQTAAKEAVQKGMEALTGSSDLTRTALHLEMALIRGCYLARIDRVMLAGQSIAPLLN